MKNFLRIIFVSFFMIALAFAVRFPKGMILFNNGDRLRVRQVEINETMAFFRYAGENRSVLLSDITWIKAKGRVERFVGSVTGGLTLLTVGGISARVIVGHPDYAGRLTGITLGATAVTYLGGRLVGGLLDPWRKIYRSPEGSGE